ncbi:MAG TPA: AAA family ATPase [Bacteroidales bacterium]|nr:AAA family ATPase [Bacteroidales bacterium]
MKYINLGNSDFKNTIENKNYFVDKSLFIEEVIKTQAQVLLIPRPRRFGKTLNLSMLRYFFDIQQPENKMLFKELALWKNQEIFKLHSNNYPVIYLSFKDAKSNRWDETFEIIKSEIISQFEKFAFITSTTILSESEKNIYNSIRSKTALNTDYQRSLKILSEYLYRYFNKKVVILIDEYDVPIQSGYNDFYDDVISFMRNLLSGAYKDNSYLYKGLITGILRVSKESIFSGLNNVSTFSILEPEFADKFGFTEKEVLQIISDFHLKTNFVKIKEWYNGYCIGDTNSIYNPWSILNFAATKNERFDTFWVNTSSDKLLKDEINKKESNLIRLDLQQLISNGSIEKEIEQNFVFPDLKKDTDLLWTLLLYSGYLTATEEISRKKYKLRIPNYEIKTVFQDIVIKWLKTDVRIYRSLLDETTNNLINNQIPEFEYNFRQVMGDTFSYFDTSTNPEFVYQSYVLGLLAILGDTYIIKSNRESGNGRYDIMLIPHDKTKFGIVIEIKQTEKQTANESKKQFSTRINNLLDQALKQIENKMYYKELLENKIESNKIIKLPIVFAGKMPYITKITDGV